MNGQREETKRIRNTNLALISFVFLFFLFGLKLVVGFEMSICGQCSTFLIYDPLVIADAGMFLLGFVALAYAFAKVRAISFKTTKANSA